MLELDDIQHFLLTRTPALVSRYEFVSLSHTEEARLWLAGLIDKVGSGAVPQGPRAVDARWVTIAFTWNGLRALGVDDASLSTFPEEFRQGMAARAAMLGDSGANHPDCWVDGLQREDLHAILILFASDVAERQRCIDEYEEYASRFPGVTRISTLNLEAIPPFDYAHDHFGYRDRLSPIAVEGSGDVPAPGSTPLKPGEFFLGYPGED